MAGSHKKCDSDPTEIDTVGLVFLQCYKLMVSWITDRNLIWKLFTFSSVQNRMEFVVTFPGAYHTYFCCVFNCAESVWFAPFDWLPHGQNTVELYAQHCLRTSISHDKLLLGAAVEVVKTQWESVKLKRNSVNNQLWTSVCGNDGILTRALKA